MCIGETSQRASRAPRTVTASAPARADFAEARRLLRQGLLESAREKVLEGLKADPQSVEGYNLLGIIYDQQKKYEDSLAAFQRALKLDPRSVETHNNLGHSYFGQSKLGLAEKEFRAALEREPHNRDANCNLGLVLLGSKRPLEAIRYFHRVQPLDEATRLNLTRAYFRGGQTTKGLELVRTIS
jgi:Tfp pilus assembly protein PilF